MSFLLFETIFLPNHHENYVFAGKPRRDGNKRQQRPPWNCGKKPVKAELFLFSGRATVLLKQKASSRMNL